MSSEFRPFANCLTDDPSASRLTLLGLCDDSQSSYLRGAAGAPPRIRRAYAGDCYNSCTEWGLDLERRVHDAGDLMPTASWRETADSFERTVAELVRSSRVPCLLGGDHAVTVPAVRAFGPSKEPIHVIQFDAHPDLYPHFEGSRSSHACTGIRMLEMEHVATLTQIGVRASNRVQMQVAARYPGRLHIFPAGAKLSKPSLLKHIPAAAKIYITLDVDVFDPAFAPGVSHPVPGGLHPRELLDFLSPPFSWRLAGIDVVEVNPDRDSRQITALLAARVLHHAMGLAIESQEDDKS